MREKYTQEELDKLTKYFISLGNPVIEWKRYHEEWGHKGQEYCTGNIQAIGLCNGLHFRIQGDPHWELREKWVLSDFTLPIEYKPAFDTYWSARESPMWYSNLFYREASKKPQGVFVDADTDAESIVLWSSSEELPSQTVTAISLIEEGKKILQERGAENGKDKKEERSFAAVATAFNAITGKNLSPAEVCLLLQILKDVRQFSQERFHLDSAVDCINYAALKGELLAEQYGEKDGK